MVELLLTDESLSIFNNKFKLRGLCFNNQYQYFLGNMKNISRDFEIKYRNDRYWKYLDFYKLFLFSKDLK